MADIVAADVTATVQRRMFLGGTVNKGDALDMLVWCTVTIDPGTTDAYPTGGIPLDVLFTAGGTYDLGFDTSQPVVELGNNLAKIHDADAPQTFAKYVETNSTTRKLMLFVSPADDGTKNVMLVEYPNEDITTNTTVTTGLATGDKNIVWNALFLGRKRSGYTGLST